MKEGDWKKSSAWWQRDVIYEIYPSSYLDTTGNGCGDLKGICRQLSYLQWLGIQVIWIVPFSQRTPMQWSSAWQAGFSQGEPWLPIASDFHDCNVDRLHKDSQPMLRLYKRLLEVRRSEPALAIGTYAPMDVAPPLFGFLRQDGRKAFAIILNFSDEPQVYHPPDNLQQGTLVLSTLDPEGKPLWMESPICLKDNEGLLIELDEAP